MSTRAYQPTDWTAALGARLIESLPREELVRLSQLADLASAAKTGSTVPSRQIAELASADLEMQRQLFLAWRRSHPAVVHAAELAPLDSSPECCERLLEHFTHEEILLEMITDVEAGGWALAESVVAFLTRPEHQAQFSACLQALKAPPTTEPELEPVCATRISIFGGHQRDQQKVVDSGKLRTDLALSWHACDSSQGYANERDLRGALRSADAVIVVTTRVSHNVMKVVKRLAQERGIPFRVVHKATASQLAPLLEEMFPPPTAP